jgi:hypothetical protein
LRKNSRRKVKFSYKTITVDKEFRDQRSQKRRDNEMKNNKPAKKKKKKETHM